MRFVQVLQLYLVEEREWSKLILSYPEPEPSLLDNKYLWSGFHVTGPMLLIYMDDLFISDNRPLELVQFTEDENEYWGD